MHGSEKRVKKADWLGLLSLGFFLLFFGIIWVATPNLKEQVKAFFTIENWQLTEVAGNIVFPEPKHNYPILYTAATQFCLIFGVFHIVILALRIVFHEPMDKIGGTISGMVFWLSIGFFFNILANKTIGWFGFLAGLIISAGLSIITSNIIKLVKFNSQELHDSESN